MDFIQQKKGVMGSETQDMESRKAMLLFELNHTFRGSLTSIMGIAKLIDKTNLESEQVILLDHLDQAALQLDADLSKILNQIDRW